MPRLTKLEREILASALVEYSKTVPPEFALAAPRILMGIAGKLDLTERVKAVIKQMSSPDGKRASNF